MSNLEGIAKKSLDKKNQEFDMNAIQKEIE